VQLLVLVVLVALMVLIHLSDHYQLPSVVATVALIQAAPVAEVQVVDRLVQVAEQVQVHLDKVSQVVTLQAASMALVVAAELVQ
jgi:hypothetical protein